MATEGVDKELVDNGIKETGSAEIDQAYDALMNEIGADQLKEKFSENIKTLFLGYRTALGNEKIYNKLYKDLRKKYAEEMKINKTLNDNQKEERRELENLNQKYNELLKQQNLAKEELKQKETAKNEFTISEKREEPEVDEGLLQDLRISNEQLTSELNEAKNKLLEAEKELEQIKEDYEKATREKKDLLIEKAGLEKKMEIDANNAKKDGENKDMEIKKIKEISEKHKKDFDAKENECKSTKEELDKRLIELEGLKKKNDQLSNDYKKLGLDYENSLKKIEKINNEKKIIIDREKKANEHIKSLEDEREFLRKKAEQNENDVKERNRKIDSVNKIVSEKNNELENLKGDLTLAQKDITSKKKEIEEQKQIASKEQRRKENAEAALKKQMSEFEKKDLEYRKLNESYKISMTNLEKNKQQLNVLDKNYRDLERARNKTTEENTKLKNKIDHLLEDIKLGDNRVQELQKKVVEYEKKLKMQREVYDSARREKNLYFKNLIETQDDLVERQNLLQFNKKEIENLKSDLKKKDDYIVDIKGKNSKFEKSLKIKEIDNNKLHTELDAKTKMCQAQEKEMEKLKINVEETAKNYSKLENEYKKTIIDRDNLSSQLIRRNDEVSILHEKIMILTTDMSKLEKEIQERKDEINNQQRAIQNLSRELKINQKFKEKSEAYARELININKELLREKNLNKALTEEVESSEKLFHRWRKLEGIDPDSLELHYKISLLQKRLIGKTEECVEKEITIQDLTKELANCKKLANKKPLFEIEESIKKYKQELSKQYDRMKSIIAELNMYRNQVEEYKTDNNRIKKENVDLQNKYHELKIRANRIGA